MGGGLAMGFANALSLGNLVACLAGCLLGTLVGVLPGLGPASTVAMLFPIAFYLPPEQTLMILAGIHYGAMYGGSTTSIVVNVPGEASSVATCTDGYQMAKQGRAGPALAIAAIGSFIAGTLGVIGLNILGPMIARVALIFGPVERLGIFIFSLTCVAGLSGGTIGRGLVSCLVGMLLAVVGIDELSGVPRLTFHQPGLLAGFEVVPVIIGLFGVAEVIKSLSEHVESVAPGRLGRLFPSREEWGPGLKASLRGSVFGFVTGLIPGMIPAVTSFLAYDLEKRVSRTPDRFGKGAIEGVAAPEAANNATAQAGFILLMALGIPTTATLAVLLAALLTYGIIPGPMMFTEYSKLAWTFVASMYIGNVILLVLNLPLVGLWARISLLPYRILGPAVLGLCFVGAFCIRNSMLDVWVCILFGVIGYGMRARGWPTAPMVLGFILGPLLEQSLRQSVSMSGGSVTVFWQHPIFVGLMTVSAASVFLSRLMARRIKAAASGIEESREAA